MLFSQQTAEQVIRALRKTAAKFPADIESYPLTDLHIQVKQESGELLIFDDNDRELTRCVVEEWLNNKEPNFYPLVASFLEALFHKNRDLVDGMHILKPYSYVLIDEEKETIQDIHLVDDDIILVNGELMKGLQEDLEDFWQNLAKK